MSSSVRSLESLFDNFEAVEEPKDYAEAVRLLESIINNEAKQFALYTVGERAIPSMIDGFKPVHRFFVYRALQLSQGNKSKFHKVASTAGGVSDAGYAHGEKSAEDAGVLIANDWNNNIPVIEGDGNFGSRLVQEAAASRYVFCRVHQNFWDIYKDVELAPKHPDDSHKPPMYYLPVIPMVLANGITGIATGYATTIFPYSRESLIKCTEEALSGKLETMPELCFPEFKGKVIRDGKSVTLEGVYEIHGKTKLIITELPVKYDRISYVKILDELEDKELFSSYKDLCGEHGFRFEITLKRNAMIFGETDEERHEIIMKTFKLRQKMSENITVLDGEGKLAEYDDPRDLIRDFVKFRIQFHQQRINRTIERLDASKALAAIKALFIEKVLDGTIEVQGVTRKQLASNVSAMGPMFKEHVEDLIAMPMYRLTTDEAQKLRDDVDKIQTELNKWHKTTAAKEYKKDLKAL